MHCPTSHGAAAADAPGATCPAVPDEVWHHPHLEFLLLPMTH
ncbi:hypothetical protein [Streptomyces atriruber]|nr:hypothetical protein [Streptomyces atriruber]